MSKKRGIKFFQLLSVPKIRKRDGQEVTHSLHVLLSNDEALLLSAYFDSRTAEDAPTTSLIRAFIMALADGKVSESTLLNEMAGMRTRAKLASELSQSDYDRAMSFINSPPIPKEIKPPAKPERRLYIPEPRRR